MPRRSTLDTPIKCLGGKPDPTLYDALTAAYDEPHRYYHDRNHLVACLSALEAHAHLADRPEEVALGLWFHDAIYDPRAQNNEARSAGWARRALTHCNLARPIIDRIEHLIFATCHDAAPQTRDEKLMVDIDLQILGQNPVLFGAYESAIRKEYSHVPLQDYRKGRAAVLSSFLARPRIFSTEAFHQRYEEAARRNIQHSLDALEPADDS